TFDDGGIVRDVVVGIEGAADPNLAYVTASDESFFVGPLHPGAVRVPLGSPVRLPRVEVGVEVEQAHGLLSCGLVRTQDRQRDRMVSPCNEGDDTGREDRPEGRLDSRERVLRVAG